MTGRLAGEVAVVTGSTAGLGKEVARLFAAEGASTVITGRNAARGEAVVAEIRAAGGEAAFIRPGLTIEDEARGLGREANATFGPGTGLRNKAVCPPVGPAPRRMRGGAGRAARAGRAPPPPRPPRGGGGRPPPTSRAAAPAPPRPG